LAPAAALNGGRQRRENIVFAADLDEIRYSKEIFLTAL
jgi:hypothetical protein